MKMETIFGWEIGMEFQSTCNVHYISINLDLIVWCALRGVLGIVVYVQNKFIAEEMEKHLLTAHRMKMIDNWYN